MGAYAFTYGKGQLAIIHIPSYVNNHSAFVDAMYRVLDKAAPMLTEAGLISVDTDCPRDSAGWTDEDGIHICAEAFTGTFYRNPWPDTWVMPVYKGLDVFEYTLTHELAHVISLASGDEFRYTLRDRLAKECSFLRPAEVSDYFYADTYESYAEAFTQWFHEDTPGLVATMYAEAFGWKK